MQTTGRDGILQKAGEQSAILINTENKMTIKAQTGSEKGSVMYLMDKIPVE